MIQEITWQSGTPELIVNSDSTPLNSGNRISLNLSKERYCIGYKEFGKTERIPCPKNCSVTDNKDAQCFQCSQNDVSFIAKTGYGLSKQANGLLGLDHAVYLAYFPGDIIKVGVALWERREVRTLEQGATACLFIARANGTATRNLERRIHHDVGFTEWVRLNAKIKGLCEEPPSTGRAQKALIAAHAKVRELAPSTILLKQPAYKYIFPRYQIMPCVTDDTITLISKIAGGEKISGTLVGLYGKILFIRIKDKIYAINGQLLAGYKTEQSPNSSDYLETTNIQDVAIDKQQSLFDAL